MVSKFDGISKGIGEFFWEGGEKEHESIFRDSRGARSLFQAERILKRRPGYI